jgi:REP element-mobilizing transposase RayT
MLRSARTPERLARGNERLFLQIESAAGVLLCELGMIFFELPGQKESRIVEGHLIPDQVHLRLSIPPKYAVAHVVGYPKGKSATQVARLFSGSKCNFTGEPPGPVAMVCRPWGWTMGWSGRTEVVRWISN